MHKREGVIFNCFSPPVMLATLVIETCLAAYTFWRYKMSPLVRLVVITLVTLAAFQLAEYFVCTGNAGHVTAWSRFGFAAITLLPPLGIHIMHVLAGKPARRLVYSAYGTMAAFAAVFLLMPGVFDNYQCTGNYVIFHLRPHVGGYYWVYYFGWLLTGLGLGLKWAQELQEGHGGKTKRQLQSIQALIVGWLVFIVPTATANVVKPETRDGLPSIMCGFAILFALILALYILPRSAQIKSAVRA